jgi:hypothetical protein
MRIQDLFQKSLTRPITGVVKAVRIPTNVTGHSGDRDRFAHRSLAGSGFVS